MTAVAPVVVEAGGMWVGWPGIHLEDPNIKIPESRPDDRTPTADLKSKQVVSVHVPKSMFDDYYNGCCNGTFWPLFHSMPDRAIFQEEKWNVSAAERNTFNQLVSIYFLVIWSWFIC